MFRNWLACQQLIFKTGATFFFSREMGYGLRTQGLTFFSGKLPKAVLWKFIHVFSKGSPNTHARKKTWTVRSRGSLRGTIWQINLLNMREKFFHNWTELKLNLEVEVHILYLLHMLVDVVNHANYMIFSYWKILRSSFKIIARNILCVCS